MTHLVLVIDEFISVCEDGRPPDELAQAVESGTWQPPEALRPMLAAGKPPRATRLGHLVVALVESILPPAGDLPALPGLDLPPRRRQVLQLLAEGLTSRQIAARLGLSKSTVNMHSAALRRQLGGTSRAHTVARAVQLGLCKMKE